MKKIKLSLILIPCLLCITHQLMSMSIGEQEVIDQLIKKLDNEEAYIRQQSAEELIKLGEQSVDPLIAYLEKENPAGWENAVFALSKINDPRSTKFLLGALEEKNLMAIAVAYEFYIGVGVPGSEPVLIESLNTIGAKKFIILMAEAFGRCGNDKLEEAARIWMRKNTKGGYIHPSESAVLWGSKRKPIK